MKKGIRLVHPSHAREVLSEVDAARLRQIGWLELKDTKHVTKAAAKQRQYRDRCKKLGYRPITAFVPEEIYLALIAARRPHETVAAMLGRFLKELGLM